MIKIDLNCDVGEGIGNEKELMPYISSCSIACGGHTGSIDSITEAVLLAKQNRVKIGAHPSFPDREHFGRKYVAMPIDELSANIKEQIDRVVAICKLNNVEVNHIKAHGALYHSCNQDVNYARMLLGLMQEYYSDLHLYIPVNSVIKSLPSKGVKLAFEGFADRSYQEDLNLVSRDQKNALITDTLEILDQVKNMVLEEKVNVISGGEKEIKVDTICVHGDTPNAVEIIKYLQINLPLHGIKIS